MLMARRVDQLHTVELGATTLSTHLHHLSADELIRCSDTQQQRASECAVTETALMHPYLKKIAKINIVSSL